MEQPVEEILLTNRDKMLRFIQSRVSDPDAAEDILQDSLLRAMRSTGDLRDDEKLVPWFYRVLNNAIIDTYRRRSTESRYLQEYGRNEDLHLSQEDEAVICACFREILPSLKPEYAEVIEDAELRGIPADQLATKMKISANNLKVRRHRARQALRQRLEETCRTCAVHGCLDCTCQTG
jgi:RNA polymerase sigma factor (sigma-70 family)